MGVKVRFRADQARLILARKNKSQNWLASRMEISSGFISQMLNGQRGVSPRMRERMLAVLKECQFDDLFEVLEGGETLDQPAFEEVA